MGVSVTRSSETLFSETLSSETLSSETLSGEADVIAKPTLQEEDARLSEERYRSLTLATTSLVFITDPNGMFTTPQASWEAYTGQTWEEQRDWGGLKMLHPEDFDRITIAWQQAVASGMAYDVEERIWHAASGQYRWCRARALPLLHSDGTVREWIGVATDIHEQKVREQQQAFLADLNERILPLSDPDKILWEAVNLIGPFLKLNRCQFGHLDFENDRYTVHRAYRHQATDTEATSAISSYGPPTFAQALQQGRTVVVNDAASDPLVSSHYDTVYLPMNMPRMWPSPA